MRKIHKHYTPDEIDTMKKYEQRIDNLHYFRCHANRAAAKALGRSEKAIASYKYAHMDQFGIVSPRMQELARLRYLKPRVDAAQQHLNFDALPDTTPDPPPPSTATSILTVTFTNGAVAQGSPTDMAALIRLLL